MANQRKKNLDGLFGRVVEGKEDVATMNRAKLFLEAVCAQSNPSACVSRLLSSPKGMPALQHSLSMDSTQTFLNSSACAILRYLQTSELEHVCNGEFLSKVIKNLVDPPMFWNSLIRALNLNILTPESVQSFAWTLLCLVSQPDPDSRPFMELALSDSIQASLQKSSTPETRNLYQKIRHIASTTTVPHNKEENGPGGRHDNDFEDFRQISIIPTVDELASTDPPFMRFATELDAEEMDSRLATHLDNQFRLLREDMVRDLRQELQQARVHSQGRRRGQLFDGLRLVDLECDAHSRQKWALIFECSSGLKVLPKGNQSVRETYLKEHRKVLANDSLACLLADGEFVGLGFIWRRESSLSQNPPLLHLHLPDSEAAIRRTLLGLRIAKDIQIIQLSTATFAYQPVLQQLQNAKLLPLADRILRWQSDDPVLDLNRNKATRLGRFISRLEANPLQDLQQCLSLRKPTMLDSRQSRSLVAGLTQQVAVVQGPPGTGKSFIGALIAKVIYSLTDFRILVLSYTNHALDQYLEDLIDIGIDVSDIVRLGSVWKASDRTKPTVLSEHKDSTYKLGRHDWALVDSRRDEMKEISLKLKESFRSYNAASAKKNDLLEYLEFSLEFNEYFDAFQVQSPEDGFQLVAENGKAVDRFYLLDRWARGADAGVLFDRTSDRATGIWSQSITERRALLKRWLDDILEERLQRFSEYGVQFNQAIAELSTIFSERDRRLMADKRIIGCTTTAAAKYVKDIQSARPEIIIVEEAGEILESHILTAIAPDSQQLVLIGDHKQLRPKAHYDLSVEKGTGYDLNRSLFERLVLKGYPHETLSSQHRMRPEISKLVRSLTYPELSDAPDTQGRAPMRGFQSNVVFVSHTVLEEEVPNAFDPRDGGSTSSKRNHYEANMTLKCVRYLAQQGYRSDQVVVLTPYLGQLRLLFDVLKKENDLVLNDMDTYDLVRAGLMPTATAKLQKQRIRISTVDNYQGEESDIVVVSLTRSNPRCDVGFMNSRERLNVLLSRARDGLILIGNATMFLEAKKGKEIWAHFLGILKEASLIYEGVPIRCERHPMREALLTRPEDFDTVCPDGGCDAACGTTLNCGLHKCPQKCHQLFDHSKMKCQKVVTDNCPIGHVISYRCFEQKPSTCAICEKKKRREEKKREMEHERQQAEAAARLQHDEKIAALDDQIKLVQQSLQQKAADDERRRIYEQKLLDLENAKKLANMSMKADLASNPPANTEPRSQPEKSTTTDRERSQFVDNATISSYSEDLQFCPDRSSPAELDWKRKKATEGISNDTLDALMEMTGLEEVKSQFLKIMDRLATAQRQNVSLKDERLGVVLLGNPGTGKTTVARHYATFLASLGVLKGTKFVETTGAKLANEGVTGTRKSVESIVEAGGGAFFIDEAYQLTSGNNYGGAAVLDYLLAEIENTTGTVVFMFAGYEKQMEKFFQHNPGLQSRIPHQFRFADYSEQELRLMLRRRIEKKWAKRMKVEDGLEGLYMRIVVRRLHRQSGKEGFGNARALENVLDKITGSQSKRLTRERRDGKKPNDFLLTKLDLIGPEPSQTLSTSSTWKELEGLVGLDSVKQSVRNILNRLQMNYKRELIEQPPLEINLNRLFLGSPGTGKTTVARLYGRILAESGVLSSSECVMKTPADFIGSVLGESERNTKAILESTRGKVLVIDEAYMLHTGSGSGSGSGSLSTSDPYRAAVVDTLVSEVHSTPGEDRAVLLLGYREQMQEMLQNVNPGMSRRFPVDNAFTFDDYNDDQLLSILNKKLQKQGLSASADAKAVAIDVLGRSRRRPHFGNAGEVENLLSKAKDSFTTREGAMPEHERSGDVVLLPQDFDQDFARSKNAVENCKMLFKGVIGYDEIVAKLVGYIESARNAGQVGMTAEDVIPFNFVFKGPPGTGKTTTARKIGQVFCDMGFLASSNVVECSVSDLVGPFVGHTGPTVKKKLDEALGQVLFIDEAYRLEEGQYAKEAVDELVDCLTKPRYKNKMIVVLAGYEAEIDRLLHVNPGLSSRFPEEVVFNNLSPEQCLDLLTKTCQENPQIHVAADDQSQNTGLIILMLRELCSLPAWGNSRDIETIAKRLISDALKTGAVNTGGLTITGTQIVRQLEQLIIERKSRAQGNDEAHLPLRHSPSKPLASVTATKTAPKVGFNTNKATRSDTSTDLGEESSLRKDQTSAEITESTIPRDPDVSEDVWRQLQHDKFENERLESQAEEAIARSKAEQELLQQEKRRLKSELEAAAKKAAEDEESRRRHEALRLQALAAKAKAEREAERLRKLREENEARKKREAQVQKKLRDLGVCCMGFRWIKQSSGYRCAGGSHFVGNETLGL